MCTTAGLQLPRTGLCFDKGAFSDTVFFSSNTLHKGANVNRYQDEPAFRSLVVEDHVVSRRYITEALRRCGWAVKHCCSAEDALSEYGTWNPHLVITDFHLPCAEGFELAARLAQHAGSKNPKATMLMISAQSSPALERRACSAEFAGMLRKPLDFNQLRRLLSDLAASSELRAKESRQNAMLHADSVLHPDQELLDLFCAELRVRLPEIEKFLLSGRLAEARSVTHQITASAAICGARPLEKCIREFSAVCRQPTDAPVIALTFTRLHRCARDVLDFPEPAGSG